MRASIEISLYPLADAYLAPIERFIERLRASSGVEVEVNAMSTQVFGELDAAMAAVTRAMRETLDSGARGAFVMKVLGVDARDVPAGASGGG